MFTSTEASRIASRPTDTSVNGGDSASARPPAETAAIRQELVQELLRVAGKTPGKATDRDWFLAAAALLRGRLAAGWAETEHHQELAGAKRAYYVSMEFLLGRLLTDGLGNLGLLQAVRAALAELGCDLDRIAGCEADPGLGNGGLGRLAACLLDSCATLDLPCWGYGIRYEFGLFVQSIENGWQVERPDHWLQFGNPWEITRPGTVYPVRFFGRIVDEPGPDGRPRRRWVDTEDGLALAHDLPVCGYRTGTVNTLRLWSAHGRHEFDLSHFNAGKHADASEGRTRWEDLSRVLYPDDSTEAGRVLRFKQHYFLASASLQDVVHGHVSAGAALDTLPDRADVHINDTHPVMGIVELMRLLVDLHAVDWHRAWDITRRVFSYTNHTLMPEALESWPVRFFETMLPRHLEIIREIDEWLLGEAGRRLPGDPDLLRNLSLFDGRDDARVRMANLAVVGSHTVNGVSQMHTGLMQSTVFADFHRLYPERIACVTNGITQRRWLLGANPQLAALISESIGADWLRDPRRLEELVPLADDAEFRRRFRAVKAANKQRLAARIHERTGIEIDAGSLFDVQVKRIHEYKRQLLKLFHCIVLYHRIRAGNAGDPVPRTVIFAGKAAPGYVMAKLIVKLIHDVASAVNADEQVSRHLRIAFLPNYGVSDAELIIPAADLSEQISTAGTEASGTGNMKLSLNGALTIGTLDGANVEIRDAVGAENVFIFGHRAGDLAELRQRGYDPWACYHGDAELRAVLDAIGNGEFSRGPADQYAAIFDSLMNRGDKYFLLADFADYLACQAGVEPLYRDPDAWSRRAILNVARVGGLSSDRAAGEYAQRIWHIAPVPVPPALHENLA